MELHYKGYSAKVAYDAEDGEFHGKIIGISDLVDFYARNEKEIEKEFHKAVEDYLKFCKAIKKKPLAP